MAGNDDGDDTEAVMVPPPPIPPAASPSPRVFVVFRELPGDRFATRAVRVVLCSSSIIILRESLVSASITIHRYNTIISTVISHRKKSFKCRSVEMFETCRTKIF